MRDEAAEDPHPVSLGTPALVERFNERPFTDRDAVPAPPCPFNRPLGIGAFVEQSDWKVPLPRA